VGRVQQLQRCSAQRRVLVG